MKHAPNTHLEIILTGPDRWLRDPAHDQCHRPIPYLSGSIGEYCQACPGTSGKNRSCGLPPGGFLLEISDDGVGFDIRKMSLALGHGLANMHTRARKVGGDIEINSEPGKGTSILAWVTVESE